MVAWDRLMASRGVAPCAPDDVNRSTSNAPKAVRNIMPVKKSERVRAGIAPVRVYPTSWPSYRVRIAETLMEYWRIHKLDHCHRLDHLDHIDAVVLNCGRVPARRPRGEQCARCTARARQRVPFVEGLDECLPQIQP